MNRATDFIKKHYIAIIVIIILIIVIFYLKRNWYKLFPAQSTNIVVNGVVQSTIPDEKQNQVKDLADVIYSDIYSTNILTGHESQPYSDANSLTDAELIFLDNYYKTYISKGTSLLSDMNGEYYSPFDSGVNGLKDRLNKLNLV